MTASGRAPAAWAPRTTPSSPGCQPRARGSSRRRPGPSPDGPAARAAARSPAAAPAPPEGANLFQPALHPRHLAHVLAQRLQLQVDHLGDVHLVIDLAGAPEEDLLGAVRLQTLRQQLRKAGAVAGQRVDAVQGHRAGAAVVGVVDEGVAHYLVRIAGEHRVRADRADRAHYIAGELTRVGQLPVHVVKEEDVFDA